MTVHPVLPPLLLGVVFLLIIAAQTVALRRWRASGRDRAELWRWLGVTAAAVFLVAAAARVVITDEQTAARIAGDVEPNVFLVVDRSPEMAVADIDGDARMAVARDDINALIDRYPRARVAVIEFASAPSLAWPLSADTWSLRPVLETITPHAYRPDAVTQANAGAANTVLRYQLISAVQQYPRAPNLVYYLGAGARESSLPAREFNPPAGSIDGGAVLGYGTSTGGPIPDTDVERSAVDEVTLRAVADQLGVPYVPRTVNAPLADVLPDGHSAEASAAPVIATGRWTETYWLPALGAAALILAELYLVLRDFRRSRFAGTRVPT